MTRRRPVWRRLASRARHALYRVITIIESVTGWRRDPLLPPAHLRMSYYRTGNPAAFARARDNVLAELMTRGLQPEHRVLDIGSGIGNLAVGLTGYLRGGSYDGVEIHREAVAWCQRAITSAHPTFRFHRADLQSVAYNPHGGLAAAAYRFPFPDRSFDVIFLGSVFTHMLPDDVAHYLHEISRMLAPGGLCIASYFLINDDTRAGIVAGRSFRSFRFEHASGHGRLDDETKPEAAVALEEAFVRRIHADAGLRIRDVRRGLWWSGTADDQDVLTAVPIP